MDKVKGLEYFLKNGFCIYFYESQRFFFYITSKMVWSQDYLLSC